MKLKRGYAGGLYIVFKDEEAADNWAWLFWNVLKRRYSCFNGYNNAFKLI